MPAFPEGLLILVGLEANRSRADDGYGLVICGREDQPMGVLDDDSSDRQIKIVCYYRTSGWGL
ncbi:hypothetical protein D3C85_1577420 [compost metagenome]